MDRGSGFWNSEKKKTETEKEEEKEEEIEEETCNQNQWDSLIESYFGDDEHTMHIVHVQQLSTI